MKESTKRILILTFASIIIALIIFFIIPVLVEEMGQPTTTEQRYIDAMELYLSDFESEELRLISAQTAQNFLGYNEPNQLDDETSKTLIHRLKSI